MRNNLQFLILLFALSANVYAVSPTVSPSATPPPTESEEEKIQEIRQAIKEQVTEIKDKIEKKAYVGSIFEITDSTLTISNFRGKQRVRIMEDTTIINAGKKEIAMKDLALEDKIIAMGEPDVNDTLESKRILVVTPPKTPPAKKMIYFGLVDQINTKTSTLIINPQNSSEQPLNLKVDKTTFLVNQTDSKETLKFADFSQNQKVIIVYPQTAEGKTPLAKTIFLLPQ